MLEPISNFSLNLAIEQSPKQRELGARTHLRSLAEGNVKSNDILNHGARFEFVKRAGRELDAETGQEFTLVGGSNDARGDSSTVSQPVKKLSRSSVEEGF